MKKTYIIWLLCFLSGLCLLSCTSSNKNKPKPKKIQSEAYRELGVAYMSKGEYTAALRELLKAEKIYPNDHHLQDYLGLTYLAKNRPNLAIKHFKKALHIKPDYAPAKNNLGRAYLTTKDWDKAITIFKEASNDLLYATPHFPIANIGWAYYNKKQYRLAEEYYLKALDLEPKFIQALYGLGKTYIAMGRLPEAVQAFRKTVEISPDSPELYLSLGKAYVLSENYGKAREAFAKVISLAPESSFADEARTETEKIRQRCNW